MTRRTPKRTIAFVERRAHLLGGLDDASLIRSWRHNKRGEFDFERVAIALGYGCDEGDRGDDCLRAPGANSESKRADSASYWPLAACVFSDR